MEVDELVVCSQGKQREGRVAVANGGDVDGSPSRTALLLSPFTRRQRHK